MMSKRNYQAKDSEKQHVLKAASGLLASSLSLGVNGMGNHECQTAQTLDQGQPGPWLQVRCGGLKEKGEVSKGREDGGEVGKARAEAEGGNRKRYCCGYWEVRPEMGQRLPGYPKSTGCAHTPGLPLCPFWVCLYC
jgi:hypothetical protein